MHKYKIMHSLWDRNETLFFKVLVDNIKEIAPVVYTPTVGEACLQFSHVYTRARGMHFSALDRGHMKAMIYNWPEEEVDVIVVTDGGRVLGLGDLGANGMGIPIGKSALYIAAGLHPSRVLPVMLDVGTNNDRLLSDDRYLGIRQKRISGDEYFEIVNEFMDAVRTRWPKVCVQFEDFSSAIADQVLQRHRYDHLCFNDDIQGTGAMTLGGLLSAIKIVNPSKSLRDQRIVLVGAGAAGQGVARAITLGMKYQGMSDDEIFSRFWVIDQDGLMLCNRAHKLGTHLVRLARKTRSDKTAEPTMFEETLYGEGLRDGSSLIDVIKAVRPTILLGVSGTPEIFTRQVIEEMHKHAPRPIIFPMSNPTSRCEASAENVLKWTNGQAVFASGSPFAPVLLNGKEHTISQANNFYIFPAIGLASVVCEPVRITEEMFTVAAHKLSELVSPEERAQGRSYPDLKRFRDVAVDIAMAVCRNAWKKGFANTKEEFQDDDESLRQYIREFQYIPDYVTYVAHGHSRRD